MSCSKNVQVEELWWYCSYKGLGVQYSDHTDLKITSLRYDPFVDELLGVLCKTQEKFSICFQLVDGFNCLVNLVIQALKINNKTDYRGATCFLKTEAAGLPQHVVKFHHILQRSSVYLDFLLTSS